MADSGNCLSRLWISRQAICSPLAYSKLSARLGKVGSSLAHSGERRFEKYATLNHTDKLLNDEALLDKVQCLTWQFFHDTTHPFSLLAPDRAIRPDRSAWQGTNVCTTGGTGFAVVALVIASERGWLSRDEALRRLLRLVACLERADRFHGAWPHFLHGESGRVIPFSAMDDGADIVETTFLIAGLLVARQYFHHPGREAELRRRIERLWQTIEWHWFERPVSDAHPVLRWHWSPVHEWSMNLDVRGWNECLLSYILAAASPTSPISSDAYHRGWATGVNFRNGQRFHDIELPLGPDGGGPLFWSQYAFLFLDPRGLADHHANYWQQNLAHTRINRAHCIANPHHHSGYGENCWGLTASDSPEGYAAHEPRLDLGVISPTAAVSAMPYTPDESMQALRHFHDERGTELCTPWGFIDAFSPDADWFADTHLAIDQGPIIAMIENHRSALVWELFMSCPEVRAGLARLGFRSGMT
ncbi:MAG: beta-glucosidase [Gammaproteobacteria bacterium]|nr:MAG: beta-glucosidase [Gammaproteobacteria bacterium]